MERAQRKSTLKKTIYFGITAILMCLLGIVNFILIVSHKYDWLIPSVEENERLRAIMVLSMFLGPVLIGVVFLIINSAKLTQLTQHRRDSYFARQKFKINLLWECINSGDFDKATDVYNSIPSDNHGYRAFANGAVTALYKLRGDEEKVKKADDRIKSMCED